MRNSIVIRKAVPSEAAYLSALALRSKAYWGYSRDFIKSCQDELTFQPNQIDDDRFNFLTAEKDSTIAGFYALEKISKTTFELEALFVEPLYIGTGIGRRLIQHAIKSLVTKYGRTLLIQGDPNAKRFYLAAGGKLIGSRESRSVPGRFLPLFEIAI